MLGPQKRNTLVQAKRMHALFNFICIKHTLYFLQSMQLNTNLFVFVKRLHCRYCAPGCEVQVCCITQHTGVTVGEA